MFYSLPSASAFCIFFCRFQDLEVYEFMLDELAPIEVKSPEPKKQSFLGVKKRPTEALFTPLETMLFWRGLETKSGNGFELKLC
jgi:hypothetical protein